MSGPARDRFVSSGFAVLRSPVLPLDELTAWSAGLRAPDCEEGGDRLAEALAADESILRERLAAVVARPEVREALAIASPELVRELGAWVADPSGRKGARIQQSLSRYFARMSSRSTPFGFFAGVALARVGERTRLELGRVHEHRRLTRVDTWLVWALADVIGRDPAIRPGLRFRPNSSAYALAGQVRWVERRIGGERMSYQLSAADPNPFLDAALARARAGATPREIAESVAALDPEVGVDDALAYVDELVEGQLLVPELVPTTTNREPVDVLLERLQGTGEAAGVRQTLTEVAEALAALDAGPPGTPTERYEALAERLATLPVWVEGGKPFQAELFKHAPGLTLSAVAAERIGEVVRAVYPALPSRHADLLARFRAAFVARWEDAEVPLVQVLDEEDGIGFENLPQLPRVGVLAAVERHARAREQALVRLLSRALAAGEIELRLTEDDVRALSADDPPPIPDAFSVLCTLLAPSEAAVDAGDAQFWLESVAGPGGVQTMGRVTLSDAALAEAAREHLRREAELQPDAIFAEVVHLPEGSLGRIVSRPVLRDWEIPFLGDSGAPHERQILVSDLRLSVRGDRVVLRSERLGREVIPRLANAHNFAASGLGTYQLLAFLQHQHTAHTLQWSWGDLDEQPFLPRVSFRQAILSRARWRVPSEEVGALARLAGAERHEAVRAWRRRRGIPRHVAWAEYDNLLPVDLENVLSVDAFLGAARSASSVALVEWFRDPAKLCAHGPEGRFAHELIVPFVRAANPPAADPTAPKARVGAGGRVAPERAGAGEGELFGPGSEWLYVKLYSGPATADRLLREMVAPLAERTLASGAADGWFFMRFADPNPHLRVRFHGDPVRLGGEVLPALHQAAAPWLENGALARVQLDTYRPEVARYGGAAGIRIAERMFRADSDAVAALLADPAVAEDGRLRGWLALCGIDALLDDFGFDDAGKRAVLAPHEAMFATEFRVQSMRKRLGDVWRQHRPHVDAALIARRGGRSDAWPWLEALRARSGAWGGEVAAMVDLHRAGRLEVSVPDLVRSLAHMHANRLLRFPSREQEASMVHMLLRSIESAEARARKAGERLGRVEAGAPS